MSYCSSKEINMETGQRDIFAIEGYERSPASPAYLAAADEAGALRQADWVRFRSTATDTSHSAATVRPVHAITGLPLLASAPTFPLP
jgi:hypothetical protein